MVHVYPLEQCITYAVDYNNISCSEFSVEGWGGGYSCQSGPFCWHSSLLSGGMGVSTCISRSFLTLTLRLLRKM